MKIYIFDRPIFIIEERKKNTQKIIEIAEELTKILYLNKHTFEETFPVTKEGYFFISHKDLASHFETSMYVIRKTLELLEFIEVIQLKKVGKPERKYMKICEHIEALIEKDLEAN